MTSRIDTTSINVNFPRPRVTNDTQGFRDNFAAIRKNLDLASLELSRIQAKYLDVSGDVVGFSSDITNSDKTAVSLRLTLADTGVNPGIYRNPVVTVDAKGRVMAISDGAVQFLPLTGGTVFGDLVVEGNLAFGTGGRVQGRRVDLDGVLLDRVAGGDGIVVAGSGGVSHRSLTGGDGLSVRDTGTSLRIGVDGFSVTFEGDVTGKLDLRDLKDAAVRLDLSAEALSRNRSPRLGGPLDMQGFAIANVGVPKHGYQVGDRNYNDTRYLRGLATEAQGLVVGRGRGIDSLPREIVGTNGLVVRNGDGVNGDPTITARDFTLQLVGDVSGSAIVEGLKDTQIRVRLLNTWTKAEIRSNFLSQQGGTLAGDLAISGGLTVSGTVQGRDLAQDGALIDALRGGPGLMVQKDASQFGRCILIGEDNQIQVFNGDGRMGHPVIGLAANPRLPGTGAVTLPSGSTRQRPAGGPVGGLRYNETVGRIEAYQEDRWSVLARLGELPAPSYRHAAETDILWDVGADATLDVRMTGDTLVRGANHLPGGVYRMLVRQGGTEAHRLSFGPEFRFSGGREFRPQPGTTDIIEFVSDGEALYGHVRPGYL